MEGRCGVSEPSVFSTYEAGWVYILSNAGHPDILKIGYTRRSVEHRIDQLNTTGTPYKHTLRFAWHVQNPAYLEGEIHRALAYCRIEGKEFFKVALALAVVESNRVIAEKGVKVFDMLGVVPSETKPALHQVAAPPARRPAPRAQARSRPIDGQMTTEVASRGKASVALRWIPLVSSPHWQK
jgi:hypothetical protein